MSIRVWTEMHSSCVSRAAFGFLTLISVARGGELQWQSLLLYHCLPLSAIHPELGCCIHGSGRLAARQRSWKQMWLFLISECACDITWGRWFGLLMLGLFHTPTQLPCGVPSHRARGREQWASCHFCVIVATGFLSQCWRRTEQIFLFSLGSYYICMCSPLKRSVVIC